ncbi:hypothetical protein UNDKW_5956 (plasmid) [Undibacterium sp. KW1]|uniref:hypothetical protein n=1 Tax=Undibacterium sp. KW1 TaxID=2058624 RepID=UPI001331FA92|nr:hypothetical protein [Undibacterium sp. KW1]BBB64229.1 hypothetical protein UNDKW_5956 [Undibacterium sp. KW1]
MGDLTKFILCAKLDCNSASDMMDIISNYADKDFILPEHEFFSAERWQLLLYRCSVEVINDDVTLNVSAKFKHYDNEIEKFCDWITSKLSPEMGEQVIGSIEVLACAEGYPGNSRETLAWKNNEIVFQDFKPHEDNPDNWDNCPRNTEWMKIKAC